MHSGNLLSLFSIINKQKKKSCSGPRKKCNKTLILRHQNADLFYFVTLFNLCIDTGWWMIDFRVKSQ
ncbi:MAG TPA: hypothetical protein DIS96_11130 [Pusillimonas sp.]|nr:hypothetical protein [Pusillimonas sp.]HCP77395.1 hypothetical protein [Pusillimonas sp.]